jgi:hypothetical protein
MKTQSHKSTRWWVIFLFIPLLLGCSGITVLWEITIWVGERIAETVIGYTIPQVIDQLLQNILHRDVGYVIPDSNNPLYGTYSTTMEFKNITTGKPYKIPHPRMYRVSLQSEWELAPDLKAVVDQALS